MVKWIDICQVFQEVFSPSGLTCPLLAGAIFSFHAVLALNMRNPLPQMIFPQDTRTSALSVGVKEPGQQALQPHRTHV